MDLTLKVPHAPMKGSSYSEDAMMVTKSSPIESNNFYHDGNMYNSDCALDLSSHSQSHGSKFYKSSKNRLSNDSCSTSNESFSKEPSSISAIESCEILNLSSSPHSLIDGINSNISSSRNECHYYKNSLHLPSFDCKNTKTKVLTENIKNADNFLTNPSNDSDTSTCKNENDDSKKTLCTPTPSFDIKSTEAMALADDIKSDNNILTNPSCESQSFNEEDEISCHNQSPSNFEVSSSSSGLVVIKSSMAGSDGDEELVIFTPDKSQINLEYSTPLNNKNEEEGCEKKVSKRKRKSKCPIKTDETNLFEDPSRSFMCSVCGKVFSKKCNLQDHIRIHTGEKPFKCGICFKGFTVNSSLQVHLRTHTGEKPFQCQECGKMFTVGSSLNAHMKIHTGDRKYQCPQCRKTFVKNGDLKNHMTSHTGEKKFQCEVCFKRFSKTSSLTLHKKLHLGEVHKCPEPNCDKEFPTSTYLQMHMKYHSADKPFKCVACDKSYRVKGDLQIHMRNHSGEKPFKCDVCSKGFTRNDTLILHMRTHTGEKPYACPICFKRFSVNCALHRHIRIHTGVKPYVCVICAKAFDSSSNRQKHMKTHQREKDMLQSGYLSPGLDAAANESCQKDLDMPQSVETAQQVKDVLALGSEMHQPDLEMEQDAQL